MRRRTIGLLGIAAAFVAGAALAAPADATLRVCTDPDNLPFSKSEGPERGLYVELAEKIGQRLHSDVRWVWWLTFNERKALRNTILADDCDVVFALPADPEFRVRGVQRSRAFLSMNYAIAAPASFTFTRLDDLKGKRVAVQFGTPAEIVMATHDGLGPAVPFRTGEEAMAALARGEVDAAFVWGPVAGYENQRRYANRYRITLLAGQGLGGQVAIGVRKGHEELLGAIDKALGELQPDIAALADKYGFPRGEPVALKQSRAEADPVVAVELVPRSVPRSGFVKTAGTAVAATVPAAAGESGDAAAGRVKFNDTCSHCHSVDGASPLPERDLRRLKRRYDDKWPDVARQTIHDGRPDLGMPTWKDALKPEEVANILAFFGTIQK